MTDGAQVGSAGLLAGHQDGDAKGTTRACPCANQVRRRCARNGAWGRLLLARNDLDAIARVGNANGLQKMSGHCTKFGHLVAPWVLVNPENF
jgi:hypothetical protein